MDDQTPEMEKMSQEMRELMAAWLANPDNATIKARYQAVHARYQRMYDEYKRSQQVSP